MGGSRDYKSVLVIRKDEDGNPILRDDGKPAMKRKYIRVTAYKRKLKAQQKAQEKSRSESTLKRMANRMKNQKGGNETEQEVKRTVGKMPASDIRRAFELARKGKYGDVIKESRELAANFVNTAKNARPISEKPKDVKQSDWLQQNPDLDKALRLLKRETTTMRKRSGKKSDQNILRMPAPVSYDRNTQRITYKAADRDAVEQTVRAIEQEMNVDLGFALDRIDWID